MNPLAGLRDAIEAAAAELAPESGQAPALERPPSADLGDYSTNAAMLLAPALGKAPREVAADLGPLISERVSGVERIEVAGPGFLNVFLADRWHREAVADVLAAGERFGAGAEAGGERVLVEFVSANPTGPLHVGGGRNAAFGDAVSRVLAFTGDTVEREYYLNDAGGQVTLFAQSIAARMRDAEPPEDGYAGTYVGELADELAAEGASPEDLDDLGIRGTEAMRRRIEATLERFGVRFDNWFSERSLREGGKLTDAVGALRDAGLVYESEGATWMRTTESGDDKDRVLIRSDGEPTYFAVDIAYHRDKLERGAQRLINPLGSDHHGYVPRMKAALAAFGFDPERFEAPIMQFVHLVEGGERAQMSKRRGEFVTLDELVDDIGADAARFLMLQRSHDRTLDLDLELARKQSQDNPVYYVQYAHARIAGILRKAADEGGEDAASVIDAAGGPGALDASAEPSELALVRRLLELPGEVAVCGERLAPHRLCAYATATAADFHAFYRDCRVVGAEPGVEAARLGLCVATRRTIATTLDLLGVSAPDRM
jgi:arginyl-tRNA synthetase